MGRGTRGSGDAVIVKPRFHSVLKPSAPGRLDTTVARDPREATEAMAIILARA